MALTVTQHSARAEGLGGSDSPIVLGLSARMSARELYHVKRGELAPRDPEDDTAWIGHEIEPLLWRRYQHETGRKTRPVRSTLRHPDLPYILGHPDRLVGARSSRRLAVRILELKSRRNTEGWGKANTDNVPQDVIVQVEHYLGITGIDVADVQVIFGGIEFRRYEVGRDQNLIDHIFGRCGEFWNRVQESRPPAPDWEHGTTPRLVKRLYPGTDGRFLESGVDVPDIEHWHDVLQESRELEAQYRRAREAAEAHIRYEMQTAARLMLPDGGLYQRKRVQVARQAAAEYDYIDFRYIPPPRIK